MARNKQHAHEPHRSGYGSLLNWMRAAVLGANDGIVSTSSLIIGVAGAGSGHTAIVTAGFAGLVSGSLSMAAGEYVSVSSQRDSEQAMIRLEREELATEPEEELNELAAMYQNKGLREDTAREVAIQLTAHDSLAAHADIELGIDLESLASPSKAALASATSFALGAVLPLLAAWLSDGSARVVITMIAVVVALAFTGFAGAKLGKASVTRQIIRNEVGGIAAMLITYGIGSLVGTHL